MSTLSWFAVPDLTKTFENASPLVQAVLKLLANLKWNSSMIVGLALWGLLIGARESLPDKICSAANTGSYWFWIAGMILAGAAPLAEFFTDLIVEPTAESSIPILAIGTGGCCCSCTKTCPKGESTYECCVERSWPALKARLVLAALLRLVSNALFFYTFVLLVSSSWISAADCPLNTPVPWPPAVLPTTPPPASSEPTSAAPVAPKSPPSSQPATYSPAYVLSLTGYQQSTNHLVVFTVVFLILRFVYVCSIISIPTVLSIRVPRLVMYVTTEELISSDDDDTFDYSICLWGSGRIRSILKGLGPAAGFKLAEGTEFSGTALEQVRSLARQRGWNVVLLERGHDSWLRAYLAISDFRFSLIRHLEVVSDATKALEDARKAFDEANLELEAALAEKSVSEASASSNSNRRRKTRWGTKSSDSEEGEVEVAHPSVKSQVSRTVPQPESKVSKAEEALKIADAQYHQLEVAAISGISLTDKSKPPPTTRTPDHGSVFNLLCFLWCCLFGYDYSRSPAAVHLAALADIVHGPTPCQRLCQSIDMNTKRASLGVLNAAAATYVLDRLRKAVCVSASTAGKLDRVVNLINDENIKNKCRELVEEAETNSSALDLASLEILVSDAKTAAMSALSPDWYTHAALTLVTKRDLVVIYAAKAGLLYHMYPSDAAFLTDVFEGGKALPRFPSQPACGIIAQISSEHFVALTPIEPNEEIWPSPVAYEIPSNSTMIEWILANKLLIRQLDSWRG